MIRLLAAAAILVSFTMGGHAETTFPPNINLTQCERMLARALTKLDSLPDAYSGESTPDMMDVDENGKLMVKEKCKIKERGVCGPAFDHVKEVMTTVKQNPTLKVQLYFNVMMNFCSFKKDAQGHLTRESE